MRFYHFFIAMLLWSDCAYGRCAPGPEKVLFEGKVSVAKTSPLRCECFGPKPPVAKNVCTITFREVGGTRTFESKFHSPTLCSLSLGDEVFVRLKPVCDYGGMVNPRECASVNSNNCFDSIPMDALSPYYVELVPTEKVCAQHLSRSRAESKNGRGSLVGLNLCDTEARPIQPYDE